jgi:imidazolonepropionase-like amidohydrolase
VLLLAAAGCSDDGPRRFDVRAVSPPPAAVFIRDAAVLDVRNATRAEHRDVLVRDGVIEAISESGAQPAPAGATVIDGAGAMLVPGLVDMHGHVTANPAPIWVGGLPDPENNLRAFLYAGVTTVFDPADGSGDAFTRRAEVASGALLGPRIFTAGPMLTAPDGHPIPIIDNFAPWWIAWYLRTRVALAIGDPATAEEVVGRLADEGADVIKIAVDEIPLGGPRLRKDIIASIVGAARARGLRVVAHIGTFEDAVDAAEGGVAGWVHGVYKERLSEEQVARIAAFNLPMVATIEVFDRYARLGAGPVIPTRLERETADAATLASFDPIPDSFDPGPLASWLELVRRNREEGVQYDNIHRLYAAGVRVLAGSDAQSGVFPGAGLHRELGQLLHAGLSPAEALRAATLDAARFIEATESPSFGAVEVGQRADLLLVEGDPGEDIEALSDIRALLLAGVPIERTTRAEAP